MNPQSILPNLDKATAPNPTLADLQDIILPDPIGAWPWAIGYWLVLALLVVLVIGAIIHYKKRAAYLAPKKAARALFVKLDPKAQSYPLHINELLKRTALSYLPREDIAMLDGKAWGQWLDAQLPETKRGRIGLLLAKRHQATPLSSDEAFELHSLTELWFATKTKLIVPAQSMPPNQASANKQEAKC